MNRRIKKKVLQKPIKTVIGEYHDYIALNQYEIVLDPSPEDNERIFYESAHGYGSWHKRNSPLTHTSDSCID